MRLEGDADLADVVRALDAEGVRHEHLRCTPSLADVFLAKTGHRLEGEEGEGEEIEQPRRVPA